MTFVRILSMRVLHVSDIRVGSVILGKNPDDRVFSKKGYYNALLR